MSGLTISDMQRLAHGTAKEKGWHDDEEDIKYGLPARLMLIVSEISEALEDFRDGKLPSEIYYKPGAMGGPLVPCGIGVEMADVLIRIGDFCGKYGIDLEEAVRQKLEYNKTRSWRHGKLV